MSDSMTFDPAQLRERHEAVVARIEAACGRAGRSPSEVTLVAVTKTWPAELAIAAYQAGMRDFGENRPEELAWKRPAVEAVVGAQNGITWHMIGTLQSRKTDETADFADVFHALDRQKIAGRLSRRLTENGRQLPTFIEVNVSGEASKSGLDLSRWREDATQVAALRTMIQDINRLPGLPLLGLMTMAPWDAEPDVIRAVFRSTRELSSRLADEVAGFPSQLSMGMTDDFEIAIEEGATHVRVGRALFGERAR